VNDEQILAETEKIMAEQIVPALASHGGGARVLKVENGVVQVELQGGCRGCMGARMTMKNGIEALLKEKIPAVREVVDATDHG
jgi:Fe-S cluster biogenesis protein NfuA